MPNAAAAAQHHLCSDRHPLADLQVLLSPTAAAKQHWRSDWPAAAESWYRPSLLQLPASISALTGLQQLKIYQCLPLQQLPDSILRSDRPAAAALKWRLVPAAAAWEDQQLDWSAAVALRWRLILAAAAWEHHQPERPAAGSS